MKGGFMAKDKATHIIYEALTLRGFSIEEATKLLKIATVRTKPKQTCTNKQKRTKVDIYA